MFDFDVSLSNRIAKKYNNIIKENQCYKNVFDMVTDVTEFRDTRKLKVLFCYRVGADGRYYRHAFCLYDDRIIEPMELDMSEENRWQMVVVKVLGLKEYFSLVTKEENPSLFVALHSFDVEALNAYGIWRAISAYDASKVIEAAEEQPIAPQISDTNKTALGSP